MIIKINKDVVEQFTRFSPYAVDGGYDAYGEMEEGEIGDYLNKEDVGAYIESQTTHIKELEEELESLKDTKYTYDMGVAGDEYINSVAFGGKHHLPSRFRWCELWDVLNGATK